ncbi:MAG: hypothetical protein IPN11_01855 [Opitutaceae bacterium]|nr:hypothetical protein [Opitutaceae bacterium]
MNPTKDEATAALAAVARSQAALRQAFRAHNGHYYLWLWGVVWALMALSAHCGGPAAIQRYFPLLCLGGGVASGAIGLLQRRQVRIATDWRFLGVLGTLLGFGVIWLLVLQPARGSEKLFVYISLMVAQIYAVAGIWFDSYLFWMGLVLAALLLIGFFFFLPVFWIWVAVFGGGALILGGCYVRYFWR